MQFNFLFIFSLWVFILSAFMSRASRACLVSLGSQEMVSDPLELELQTSLNYSIGLELIKVCDTYESRQGAILIAPVASYPNPLTLYKQRETY